MARQINGFVGSFFTLAEVTTKFPPAEYKGCSANIGTTSVNKAWCNGVEWAEINAATVQALVLGEGIPVAASRGFTGGAVFTITGTTAAQTVQIVDLSNKLQEGDCIQVDLMTSISATANNKTLTVGYGAGSMTQALFSTTRNSGTVNAFVGQAKSYVLSGDQILRQPGWFSGDQSAAISAPTSFDPTNIQLFFQGQLANAADVIGLYAYCVTIFRAA